MVDNNVEAKLRHAATGIAEKLIKPFGLQGLDVAGEHGASFGVPTAERPHIFGPSKSGSGTFM